MKVSVALSQYPQLWHSPGSFPGMGGLVKALGTWTHSWRSMGLEGNELSHWEKRCQRAKGTLWGDWNQRRERQVTRKPGTLRKEAIGFQGRDSSLYPCSAALTIVSVSQTVVSKGSWGQKESLGGWSSLEMLVLGHWPCAGEAAPLPALAPHKGGCRRQRKGLVIKPAPVSHSEIHGRDHCPD